MGIVVLVGMLFFLRRWHSDTKSSLLEVYEAGSGLDGAHDRMRHQHQTGSDQKLHRHFGKGTNSRIILILLHLSSSWTENGSARTKAWAITYRFFNVNAYAGVPIWSPTEYEHQDYPDPQACSEPWWTSPWSECSNKCGENSTRRRHVGCQVGHECAGVKPVTEEPCHANCVYRWKRGGWSLVSAASQALFNHIF